jgi:TonB family protein
VRFALVVVVALGCGSAPAPAYGGEVAPSEIKPVTDRPPFVEPVAMNRRRVAGEKLVVPDGDTIAAVRSSGVTLRGTFEYCVDQSGEVSSVSVLQSTGAARYDARIRETIRAWVFKPVVFQGAAIAACSPATFLFTAR